jgi:predicted nucleic acid-binding protein
MPCGPAGALDLHVLRSVSFCDALIVRAAVVSGCQRVLSEDMQDGANFGGVRIENPFAGV